MELKLKRTEYNMQFENTKAKAILTINEDEKGEVSIFLEDQLAYYYIIEDITHLSMDEVELSKFITDKLLHDRSRWIRDCSIIEEHRKDFQFISKAAVYVGTVGSINFDLKLTSAESVGSKTLFKIEATNDKNSDVLTFEVRAKNNETLNKKLTKYAEAIAVTAIQFGLRREELVESTFATGIVK